MEEMGGYGTTESVYMGRASSVAALESTREDEEACDGAGQSKRRREYCVPGDVQYTLGGDGKRVRSCDTDGASGSIVRNDDRQLHYSDEETQSLLFSSNPRAAASGNVQDPSGSIVNVQRFSSFEIDPTRHKIFLSHSGAQKNFVEQLCVDLEARGYLFPFFDQRHHSLPKGKDFAPLIKQAAQLCHVAVIVLSEEFLSSKWPMIELAEFYAAKHGGNSEMSMLPLFYKLSVGDLDDRSIEGCWMPKWNELASKDKRIDVTEWAAAVRGLRRVNGVRFGKNTNSEVAYRKEIVRSIWKLSPGEFVYDSAREMAGYHRICQRVSNQFVNGSGVGASVLGLYGTSGIGKTTLSKALCDYSVEEFMGRVCHVELGATTRMERQWLMLKTLCGIEEDVLNRSLEDRKGLKLMRDCMKWEPVFLVIDNLTNDESSRKEVHEYLTVGFHPKSKIMITSRSKEVLQDLLPGVKFCMSVPRLNEEEAGMIFLRSAAPMKCFSSITDEERRILGFCTQKCLLESDEVEYPVQDENLGNSLLTGFPTNGAYHPLALSAVGDFLYRFSGNSKMLRWKDSLEENNDLMRDVLQSPNITSIVRLQFSTFHSSEQLLFLDIALYTYNWHYSPSGASPVNYRDFNFWLEWLASLHGEPASVMERRLRDLKRSGMVDWDDETVYDFEFRVHPLYKEFAVWYVTEHGVTGLKNAWGVFQPCGTSFGSDHPGSKCISDLVRLRVFDSTRASIWILARKRMLELQNLVLLQLHSCTNVQKLCLEGLDSLRDLELIGLSNLVTVTFCESSGSQEDGGIFESLQYVVLVDLDSLTLMPDFRSCTSLCFLRFSNCRAVKNFEGAECPHLRELWLERLGRDQLGRSPNFRLLPCLKDLYISVDFYLDLAEGMGRVNPYTLKRRRRGGAGAVHRDSEDSNEPIDHSGGYLYEDAFGERTIRYVHLEDHFVKEGLSIVQKVLSYNYPCYSMRPIHSCFNLQEWRRPSTRYVLPIRSCLWWSFNEDDKEELLTRGLNNTERVIEWRFKDPEEYDD